jgi:predicted small secreted protein
VSGPAILLVGGIKPVISMGVACPPKKFATEPYFPTLISLAGDAHVVKPSVSAVYAPTPVIAFERIHIMSKVFSIALTVFVLVGMIPLLGACNTTAGAGKDISATGHAVTNSADKHTP